jgi:O-antigen ligase
MMNAYPWTGVGYFNFIPYYEMYYSEDVLYEKAELAHNIFVQVGADLGWVGLFIYLLMLMSCTNKTRKLIRFHNSNKDSPLLKIAFYLNTSLAGFVIAGQFVSVLFYPFLWIHMAITVCFATSLNYIELTRS